MRLEADLLLERHLRDRAEALRRPVLLLAKVFLDGVAHGLRFGDRFGLGLDPKPRLAARGIANVSHDSSQHGFRHDRHREGGHAMSGRSKIRSPERVNSNIDRSAATWRRY